MTERLAPGARRLAGLLCRQLGWRPADFWSATPAEIAAILAPDGAAASGTISRDDLNQLMERDGHG